MNISVSTLKTKAQTLLLHRSESSLESPAVAHPVRDWKITLLMFSLLVLVFGAFAILSYTGFFGAQASGDKNQIMHTSKLDRPGLMNALSLLEERGRLHEAARTQGRAFVDPGR